MSITRRVSSQLRESKVQPLRPEACQVARKCSSLEAEQAGLRAILPGGDRYRHFDMTEIRHPERSGQMRFVSTKPTWIPVILNLVSPRSRQRLV